MYRGAVTGWRRKPLGLQAWYERRVQQVEPKQQYRGELDGLRLCETEQALADERQRRRTQFMVVCRHCETSVLSRIEQRLGWGKPLRVYPTLAPAANL
jgi:hypothetical protein